MKKQLAELIGIFRASPENQAQRINLQACKPDVSHKVLELQKQEREGYEVVLLNDGEEVLYREGEKSLNASVAYTTNGFVLHTRSLKNWRTPAGNTKLSPDEYERVVSRIRGHLACEGCDLVLED